MFSELSSTPLTGAQKAAIIVRLISGEGGSVPISSLSPKTQENMVLQFQKMGRVDRETVDAVVAEFEEKLNDPSVSFPNSLASTLQLIEAQLSPEVADELRHQAGFSMQNDPWQEVAKIPLPLLVTTLLQEGLHVGAIILSKLPPEIASEAMGTLPPDVAREMAYTVQNTADIRPEVVAHIGRTLRELARPKGPLAFKATPVERVAEILNASGATQRDTTLDALAEMDAEFAAKVRKAIFTFADIPARLKPADVPAIVRDVPNEDLVMAIAAAREDMPEAVEFILTNMSKRMADQIEEEANELGPVKPKPGETAMGVVTAVIRRARDSGMIDFVEPDSDEDE